MEENFTIIDNFDNEQGQFVTNKLNELIMLHKEDEDVEFKRVGKGSLTNKDMKLIFKFLTKISFIDIKYLIDKNNIKVDKDFLQMAIVHLYNDFNEE